ncbi:MAG: site-2 protease family protein [Actinobacteria bacterium]|nr:site-2 protease family protein [Actinomycetota bacterium]
MTSQPGQPPAPGIKVATIAGVPVYIGRSWGLLALIIVALIGPQLQPDLGGRAYLVAIGYALLLLLAVMVHEGAHALGARSFGFPVHRVVADLWGGHTALDVSRSTPVRSATIAVVGPLSNLVLSAVGYGLAAVLDPGIAHGLAGLFGYLNLLLALFNLLPGLPLDGGQLVESLVWKLTGDRHKGRVAAGYCGMAVTLGVLYWFVGRPLLRGDQPSLFSIGWAFLICMFLWQGARSAIASGQVGGALSRVRVVDVLTPVAPVPYDAALTQLPTGVPPVVVDQSGTPVALVDAAALQAVPPQAAPHTSVSSVSRPQPPGWVLDLDPNAPVTELFAPLRDLGTGVVAIRQNGRLLGVVTVDAVNNSLS